MSFGIKTWSLTVVLLATAVGLWELPPDPLVRARQMVDPPAVARWKGLSEDIRRTENLIQKARWADSLTTLAIETQVEGLAVGAPAELSDLEGVGRVPWITAEHLETTRRALAERLARAVPGGSEVVVGYFIQPTHFAAAPRARVDSRPATQLYLGRKNGTPVCLLVKATSGPVDAFTYREGYVRRFRPDLDMWNGCRLAARYGLPGERITAWIESGGMAFGLEGPEATVRDPTASASKVAALQYGASASFLARERCLAGAADGCAMLFLAPEGGDYATLIDAPSWITVRSYFSPFRSDDDYILWDLEREFGPDRFSRFWTSDAGVEEAFEAAFGLPVGAWMARWVEAHIGRIQRGSAPARAAYPGTMVALALSTIIAGLWSRRRRVA